MELSNGSNSEASIRPLWAAGIAAGAMALVGVLARVWILHDVSPLEDLILRLLQDRGVSFVLRPNWTDPLVGLTEVAGFAAVGTLAGLACVLVHWSTTRAVLLTVTLSGAAQVWFGLLPRVPL